MLVGHLLREYTGYFESDPQHDTVLWFDPQREWEGLLPHLHPHPHLDLLVLEGNPLQLRHQLVSRPPGRRSVVYLPCPPLSGKAQAGGIEVLRPFLYTSKVFDDGIEVVLRAEGIALPEAPGVMKSLRPLLPALAVASVGKGRAFWTGIASLESALARLIPNFEDRLLRLLASPSHTLQKLEAEQVRGPFFDLVLGQFGVAAPVAGEVEPWADRFTAVLCLVDVYQAAGQPAGFPFQGVLPAAVHWDRCHSFLLKWQRDEMFKDSFALRARKIDAAYNLAAWANSLPEPPATSGLLNVETAVWERVLGQIDAMADKAQVVAWCGSQRDLFRKRAQGFWAREGSLAGWSALERLAEVVSGASEALVELSHPATAQALLNRYAESWWQVDRAYRRFRAQFDQGVVHMDAALKWAQRLYQDFLEGVNDRFGEAILQTRTWPPEGLSLGPGDPWRGPPPGGHERRGVLIVDALRYELGQELAERLRSGPEATVEAALSPLPSVTPLGMAALLPGSADFRVDYDGGQWRITAPRFAGNLATKADRLAWLQRSLDSAVFYDLDPWLATPLPAVPKEPRWIIVSSTEIDALGEGAATVAWHAFDALLGRLEQAVRRLLALGCAEVHLISDHGFLLREGIREADKVEVNIPGILKKAERYLVGRGLPPGDLPALPVAGSDDLVAWFPRGIGCFQTPGPYNYMHGGPSLQELVTAHVVVRQEITGRPVGVALQLVAGPEIRNAIFKVRLIPQGVDLWSRARQVTIDIARGGERVSAAWEAIVEREAVERTLRLEPGFGLAVGDAVAIRLWDAVTGELLAEQQATVQVGLDW